MKTKLIFWFAALSFMGCKTSQNSPNQNIPQNKEIKNWVDTKNYEIVSNSAQPLVSNELNQLDAIGLLGVGNSAGRISLVGNSNFLRMKNDTISANLPYYGTLHFGGYADSDGGGIVFKGMPKNYKTSYDAIRRKTNIIFDMSNGTENFNVFLTVFDNETTSMSINSSKRNSISFEGNISSLDN